MWNHVVVKKHYKKYICFICGAYTYYPNFYHMCTTCVCTGANMTFSGTHMLEIWTIGICTTCITYEANVFL